MKPSVEPALLVRKPFSGTGVENLLKWGTGYLNLDACRFAYGDSMWPGPQEALGARYNSVSIGSSGPTYGGGAPCVIHPSDLGRFPANLLHVPKASRSERERWCEGLPYLAGHEAVGRKEGSAGLTPRAGAGRSAARIRNPHPTVKPLRLMQWLCRLVTPPGGVVLDPFAGSGTTMLAAHLEGLRAIGAEMTYPEIPRVRLTNATAQRQLFSGAL